MARCEPFPARQRYSPGCTKARNCSIVKQCFQVNMSFQFHKLHCSRDEVCDIPEYLEYEPNPRPATLSFQVLALFGLCKQDICLHGSLHRVRTCVNSASLQNAAFSEFHKSRSKYHLHRVKLRCSPCSCWVSVASWFSLTHIFYP